MADILSFFESIVSFIVHWVESCIWFVVNVPVLLQILTETSLYVPSFLQGFMTWSLAATALFAVIRLL